MEIKNFKITVAEGVLASGDISAASSTNGNITLGDHVIGMNTGSNNIDGKCISVTEFSRRVGVTPQAVRKMISEGRLEAKKIGEQYVIEEKEVDVYLYRK